MKKVSFLGLGVMGYPMAGHLVKQGYEVTVYNRTTQKAEDWRTEFGGQVALTPAQAASDADVVFMCVGNDNDIKQVVMGDSGVFETMQPNTILVDHTTASATIARELSEACSQKNISFIDAPVSGGQAGAENGQLTILCGGDEIAFDRVKPVMDSYAQHSQRLGLSLIHT